MPQKSKVTYKIVKKAADELEAENIYPSNARVRSITGGGAAIVAAFLTQWREEKAAAKLLESTPLDEGIKVAIHHEIDRQVKLNTDHLQEILNQQKDSCAAMQNELAENHQLIESLSQDIDNLNDSHNKKILAFEKRISETETTIGAQNSQLDNSFTELAVVNQRLVSSNMEISNLNQQIGKAASDIENKIELISEIRAQLQESSGELRTTNQKVTDLEKQLSKSSGDLVNEIKKGDELRNELSDTKGELRVANQMNAELEKQAGKQEEQISQLRSQLTASYTDLAKLKDALRDAEKAAAVAQARAEGPIRPEHKK